MHSGYIPEKNLLMESYSLITFDPNFRWNLSTFVGRKIATSGMNKIKGLDVWSVNLHLDWFQIMQMGLTLMWH